MGVPDRRPDLRSSVRRDYIALSSFLPAAPVVRRGLHRECSMLADWFPAYGRAA